MRNPTDIIAQKIVGPIVRFKRDYLSVNARHNKLYKPIANFIFDRSKDMPVIMLAFNAISILSSHIAQIGGLKKSNRENKDYLITQELGELGLDILLTIIPPFLLNNFLSKKLDSGVWTTKSARDNLRYIIAPTVGASQKDLYNIDHIIPFKESLKNTKNSILIALRTRKLIPKNILSRLNIQELDPNKLVPMAKMEHLTTDFDVIRGNKFKDFYNGSAYDEIVGQRNGILMMAAIGYTIIASNIIIPILKNKFSNKLYRKHLKDIGETPESLKRKKRYNSLTIPNETDNSKNIFNVFSNSDNTTSTEKNFDRRIYNTLINSEPKNIFNDVYNFNKTAAHSSGMRI